MDEKKLFTLLGLVAMGILLYQRFLNPRCRWCDAAIAVASVGQRVVCPSCGRLT